MATFVLVHGSWHGGWCWKKLTPHLLKAGHTVYTPTLTGMGDRRHLHARSVGLQTHIDDISQLLIHEDLQDIFLIGHSYAGMVITGAAEHVPERIRRLIYLDAFIPQEGKSLAEMMHDGGAYHKNRAETEGDGWTIPSLTPTDMGITDPADIAWMQPRMCPITLATFFDRLPTSNPVAAQLPRSFIHTSGYFEIFAKYAQAHQWDCHELQSSHDVMITAPAELSDILNTIAASS